MKITQKAIKKAKTGGVFGLLKAGERRLERRNTYFRVKYYTKHWINGYTALADPLKIIQVSPGKINKYSYEFSVWESRGEIIGGDWDKESKPVDNMEKYQAVRQRFCEGKSWEETGIIDHLYGSIKKTGSADGCKTRAELKQRYRNIDDLYESMKKNGYKPENHGTNEYIRVHIGRQGELIFASGGRHRLAIAKILNLKRIPVRVLARHERWQKKREQLKNTENDLGNLQSHPDLQDI